MNQSETIITLAEADTEVRGATSADLDLTRNLLYSGTDEIERVLDRKIVSRGVITEYHTIRNSTSRLWLNEWPVFPLTVNPAIDAPVIYEDSDRAYGATTLLVEGTDYIVNYDSGEVTRIDGDSEVAWLWGFETVKVVYKAGYTQATVPADLKRVAAELFSMQWYEKMNGRVGLAGGTDDMGSRTFYGPAELTSHQIARLHRHRRITFGGGTVTRSSAA